jgi:predicted MFS family arabinose efflux permease
LFLKPAREQMTLFGFNFIGADLLWFIEGFAYLSIFFLLLTVSEDFKPKKTRLKQKVKESNKMMKYGLLYSWNHPVVFALLLTALLLTTAGNLMFLAFQPYLIENGIQIEQFGYLRSVIMVFAVFAPFIAQRISKNMKKNVYLAITSSVRFLFMFTLYFITGPIFTFIYWLILRNLSYFEHPVKGAYFQQHVTSKGRSTISSIENAMYSFGGFIGPLTAGLMLNYLAPRIVLAFSGLLIIPAIIVYLRIK